MSDRTVVTDRNAFRRAARDAPDGARVPVEVQVHVADPFDAYRRARDGTGGFYLATTGGQSGWGYFGVEPAERVQTRGDATALDDSECDDEGSADCGPSLAALAGLLDDERLVRGDCDVPYPCGLFGWLSYDLVRELENLPEKAVDDRGLPQSQFGLYDCVAAWEEPRDASECSERESRNAERGGTTREPRAARGEQSEALGDRAAKPRGGSEKTTLHVTACPRISDTASDASIDAAYDRGRAQALDLADRATSGDPDVGTPPVEADTAEFESDCGRDAYAERVRRVKSYVRDGDTFQANVSQRLTAPAAVHPVEAFEALRQVNPAPYSGLLEFPGIDLVSASPELLLEVEGNRAVTEPIAGTRPRGETAAEDVELETDLLGDEKERAEHAMLVDLERNDLGKVCEYGSVEVSDYRRVDRYSEVMHLVSEVEGRLRDGTTIADAIAAVFPGGTITGAPKPRTMEIIDELEGTRRGPYTGSIGVMGFDGRGTLNIVIRTLVRWEQEYHLRVGAGIVHDSVPEAEYEETLAKGRALITAVDEALGEGKELAVEGEGSE
ncbi:anthranilate synthase component I family protein [Halorussus halophilus]|uniref:anthranilate synthase component I family protein n=1 Tax=Halorussus halophilus TaxID=2650975 RepID=UPI0013017EAC|nr:anthranilate synthase component I family protein [Halorussus halophilus]